MKTRWHLAIGFALLAGGISGCGDSTTSGADADAAAVDVVSDAVATADAVADVAADATPDAVADAAPDAAADTAPDAAVDGAPDAVADVAADTAPDAVPDATPDATPDAVPDATPDAVADAAPDAVPDSAADTATAVPAELSGWCTVTKPDFSFFVTSMNAIWALSGDPVSDLGGGLGGNFGGLAGADAICQGIAAATGNGDKTWRAFLSAVSGPDGQPVHAIDRIGAGPWYDANGRLVATGIAGLLAADRPDGVAASVDDLPDECGIPTSVLGDAHDVVTGSNKLGHLNSTTPSSTCNDWTSDSGSVGVGSGGSTSTTAVMCGHSFPRATSGGPGGPGGGKGGANWLSDHTLRGCGKGANLLQNGPGTGTCIGCSGGYGALYCFAL
ncbi:MAG: hypothetical protein R3F39_09055 [Myxococcota bacterium]